MKRFVETGTLTQEDRAVSPFYYLPFEVPTGTNRINVQYSYSEGNVLDIGLFDSRAGAFPAEQGFRGWSGGARSEFFVACEAATPGYLPGDMPVGTWQVILGLADIHPEGCSYRVEIGLEQGDCLPVAEVTSIPTSNQPGWYKGDLQSHSHHSDAKGSLEDLVKAAQANSLDFLAVTDHNTVSHHRHLAGLSSPDLLLIPGQEVTTYRGHANVWGADDWVDFRVERDDDLEALVEQAHRRGGLFSINHPKVTPNCLGCDWAYPVPDSADCFEAWQGPWLYRNWESLARYDALLAQGRHLTLVGGSDRHQPGWPDTDPKLLQLGSPTTWLYLEGLSVKSVLEALRAGRGFVSESPAGPQLRMSVEEGGMGSSLSVSKAQDVKAKAVVQGAQGDLLRWVGQRGVIRSVPVETELFEDCWTWQAEGPFLRAEVIAQDEARHIAAVFDNLKRVNKVPEGLTLEEISKHERVRALANPVYLNVT